MGEENSSRWSRVKKRISNKYSLAKQRWQEFKAELNEDSNDITYQSNVNNDNSQLSSSGQGYSQVTCSFCHHPVPNELLLRSGKKDKIVCESCGMEIEI